PAHRARDRARRGARSAAARGRAMKRMLLAAALLALPAHGAPARPPALEGVGIEQHLDAQLPLDLTLRDESGGAVRLRELFRGRPVVLSLVYYECPMLC